MNILFLLHYYPIFGGGESVTLALSNKFVEDGYNVSIAYFVDSVNECKKMPYIDHRIHVIKLASVNVNELHQTIVGNCIDILINQWLMYTNLCSKSVIGTRTTLVGCLHMVPFPRRNIEGVYDWKSNVIRFIEPFFRLIELPWRNNSLRKYILKCDKFVFLSKSYIDRYSIYNKLTREQIHNLYAIPNPLTYKQDCRLDKILSLKKNEILFVGRIQEHHKRISLILNIWHKISSECNNGWYLRIVGEGPDLMNLQRISEKMGLTNISFEGYQYPIEYYKKARIFLMTSAYEGFPMTLMESLQNGVVPIVMNTFSSLFDIISDGENGFIIEDMDIDAFCQRLKELMYDDDLCSSMNRKAFVSANNFSADNIAKKWYELFDDSLNLANNEK